MNDVIYEENISYFPLNSASSLFISFLCCSSAWYSIVPENTIIRNDEFLALYNAVKHERFLH